ncbi:MAG: LON peptidase substrate-binding domain-containing protein [Verrucomicrobiota bacterium]
MFTNHSKSENCPVLNIANPVFPHQVHTLRINEGRNQTSSPTTLLTSRQIILIPEQQLLPLTQGTICLIKAARQREDGRISLLIHGINRVCLPTTSAGATDRQIDDTFQWLTSRPPESCAGAQLIHQLKTQLTSIIASFPKELAQELREIISKAGDREEVLADLVAGIFVQDNRMLRKLFFESSVQSRLELLTAYFEHFQLPTSPNKPGRELFA